MNRTTPLLATLVLASLAAAAGLALAHGDAPHDPVLAAVPDVKAPRKPTYNGHVAKILERNCTTCHHEGDIGPMVLDDFESASTWMRSALEEIAAGTMPPWQPTKGVGEFAGELGLSDRDWATLARWFENEMPEGRARRGKSPPSYDDRWAIGEPDAVLSYGEPFVVQGQGDDVYRCFPITTDFGRDVYVRAIDVRPGDRRVAHHAVLYMDPEGESVALDAGEEGPGYTCFGGPGTSLFNDFQDGGEISTNGDAVSPIVGGWAPGNRPHLLPKGSGVRIPAGATLILQMHYHPYVGEDVSDLTEFGLYFSDREENEDVYLLPVVNMDFTIPAGDAAYEVTAELDPQALLRASIGLDIPVSAQVLAVMPHMHLLGREISVEVGLPDGSSQRLVEIDDWSFDWQDTYVFNRPVAAPIGSVLRLRCVFDNSADNPNNPNVPPLPVSWGERTVDEMALAFVAVRLRFPDTVLALMSALGRDLPHPLGLPEIQAPQPPEVRRVRVDRRGRVVVDVRRMKGGGRVEVDGNVIDGSLSLRRNLRRFVLDMDAALGDVPPGTDFEVRVRRADGRLSAPYTYTTP